MFNLKLSEDRLKFNMQKPTPLKQSLYIGTP